MSVKFLLSETQVFNRLKTKDIEFLNTKTEDIDLPEDYSLLREMRIRVDSAVRSLHQKKQIMRQCRLDTLKTPLTARNGQPSQLEDIHFSEFASPRKSFQFGKAKRDLDFSNNRSPGPAFYNPSLSSIKSREGIVFSSGTVDRAEHFKPKRNIPSPNQYYPSKHFLSTS